VKCCDCKRNIAAGVAAAKMVVEYLQADGTVKVFGFQMPDGPLTAATGSLLHGHHAKCYHMVRKRQARGDAVTGRVLAGTPTGYEIEDLVLSGEQVTALGLSVEQARAAGTAAISARLARLRALADSLGRQVGDPGVTEAFQAGERGGPYPHRHDLRLEMYQLRAHLGYAHGTPPAPGDTDLHAVHERLHVAAAQAAALAGRAGDAGHAPTEERDWRQQVAVEVNELT